MFTQEQVRGHTVCIWNIPIPRRFQLWPANHCFGKSRGHTMYTSVKVLCKVEHAEHHQLSTPFGALKSECLANPILPPSHTSYSQIPKGLKQDAPTIFLKVNKYKQNHWKEGTFHSRSPWWFGKYWLTFPAPASNDNVTTRWLIVSTACLIM